MSAQTIGIIMISGSLQSDRFLIFLIDILYIL